MEPLLNGGLVTLLGAVTVYTRGSTRATLYSSNGYFRLWIVGDTMGAVSGLTESWVRQGLGIIETIQTRTTRPFE